MPVPSGREAAAESSKRKVRFTASTGPPGVRHEHHRLATRTDEEDVDVVGKRVVQSVEGGGDLHHGSGETRYGDGRRIGNGGSPDRDRDRCRILEGCRLAGSESPQGEREGDRAQVVRPVLELESGQERTAAGAGGNERERPGNGGSARGEDAVGLRAAGGADPARGQERGPQVRGVAGAGVGQAQVDRDGLAGIDRAISRGRSPRPRERCPRPRRWVQASRGRSPPRARSPGRGRCPSRALRRS